MQQGRIRFRALFDSSATVRAARLVVHGSRVCRAIGDGIGRIRTTRARFRIAVRNSVFREQEMHAAERLHTVAADSRLATAVYSVLAGPSIAWPAARVNGLLGSILRLDLVVRVSLVCWMLIAATVTHAVLMAVLARPVGTLGWSVRAGLLGACLLALWRPRAVAAAWTDWTARVWTAGELHQR